MSNFLFIYSNKIIGYDSKMKRVVSYKQSPVELNSLSSKELQAILTAVHEHPEGGSFYPDKK